MIKSYFNILITFLFIQSGYSQISGLDFAYQFGGVSDDRIDGVALDSENNTFVTGQFEDEVDFDPDSTVLNISSNGGSDIFISKFDMDGQWLWTRTIGGIFDDFGSAIIIDQSGDLIITGAFRDTVDFDPGQNDFFLNSSGNSDVFILKLDTNGNFIWAGNVGGSEQDSPKSVAIDNSNNIIVSGSFRLESDFDPGPNSSNLISNGLTDMFILKLNTNGSFIWARKIGGTASDLTESVITIEDDIIYTGVFSGTVDFDPGSTITELVASGNFDTFFSKLNSSGEFVWVRQLSGNESVRLSEIALSSNQNLVATGSFSGTVDFDPSSSTLELTSSSGSNAFIIGFNSQGELEWIESLDGTDIGLAIHLSVSQNNDIYIIGYFRGSVDFDPSSEIFNLSSNGGFDVFLSQYTSDGSFVDAVSFGGNGDDVGFSVAVNTIGSIYASGLFEEMVDFDPGSDTFFLNSNGGRDSFFLKLISDPLGIENNQFNDSVVFFPNPTTENINILLDKNYSPFQLNIRNSLGQLLKSKRFKNTDNTTIDLPHLDGIYFIELILENKESLIYRVIKK